jgi:hypothetical protein
VAIPAERTDTQTELAAELLFREDGTSRRLDGIARWKARHFWQALSVLNGVASLSQWLHRCSYYTQLDIGSNVHIA